MHSNLFKNLKTNKFEWSFTRLKNRHQKNSKQNTIILFPLHEISKVVKKEFSLYEFN